MRIRSLITLFFALLLASIANARTVYLIDYGLENAQNGLERFEIIRKAHEKAISIGAAISYRGLDRIELEIPKGAKSIPLPFDTDFAGVEISVKNTMAPYFTLFMLSQEMAEVEVTKEQIESGLFNTVCGLNRGKKILVIEDETPWVINRKGYSYGATRRDILFLKRGKAQNTVTASYNNEQSSPKCLYCDVSGQRTKIKNLVFTRTVDSEQITKLLCIENQNDVTIVNITINTPESDLYGDRIFEILNVTNLKMREVTINGTYSRDYKFGYGISMNNVWKVKFKKLNAHGHWGVFGNNNVNFAVLEDCDINRFDIHCYGRDVYCYRTTFRNIYNQFSSLYGQLVFEGCEFVDFIPVLFEYSYSAYTPFNLVLKDCRIKAKEGHPYLVAAGNVAPMSDEAREELSETSWPNITIDNVEVTLPSKQKNWLLFKISSNPTAPVKSIKQVKINGLRIKGSENDCNLRFSNYTIQTGEEIHSEVEKSSITKMIF